MIVVRVDARSLAALAGVSASEVRAAVRRLGPVVRRELARPVPRIAGNFMPRDHR